MEKTKGKTKKKILLVLLAIACVGAVELVACRFCAPELYVEITAPVRSALQAVGAFGQKAGDSIADWMRKAYPEEKPDSQAASEPEVQPDDGVPDPVTTEMREREGREILTGGSVEMVYYDQGAEEWGTKPYGTDLISTHGCGPTAMAMVVSSLTQQRVEPDEMARWAVDHGYWAARCGSYLSIVQGTAKAYGLEANPCTASTPEALRLELATGKIVVALMTTGHFTNSGHFIILRGVTLDGNILVADPNSKERSLMVWDAQLILDELSATRVHGSPLWSITIPA